MWDDAAPVIRSERVSHLPYNINNHNFITIKRVLYYACTDERNGCVRDGHCERERRRASDRRRGKCVPRTPQRFDEI